MQSLDRLLELIEEETLRATPAVTPSGAAYIHSISEAIKRSCPNLLSDILPQYPAVRESLSTRFQMLVRTGLWEPMVRAFSEESGGAQTFVQLREPYNAYRLYIPGYPQTEAAQLLQKGLEHRRAVFREVNERLNTGATEFETYARNILEYKSAANPENDAAFLAVEIKPPAHEARDTIAHIIHQPFQMEQHHAGQLDSLHTVLPSFREVCETSAQPFVTQHPMLEQQSAYALSARILMLRLGCPFEALPQLDQFQEGVRPPKRIYRGLDDRFHGFYTSYIQGFGFVRPRLEALGVTEEGLQALERRVGQALQTVRQALH